MIQIVKSFNKEDCKHFKWTFSRACCGRGTTKAGACAITIDGQQPGVNKVCSTKQKYCEYVKKEE